MEQNQNMPEIDMVEYGSNKQKYSNPDQSDNVGADSNSHGSETVSYTIQKSYIYNVY